MNITIPALIKQGDHIIIQDRPCRVAHISCNYQLWYYFVGIDIFTGEKYTSSILSNSAIEIPIITSADYELHSIVRVKSDDGETTHRCTVIDNNGILRDNVYVSDTELAHDLHSALSGYQLTIVTITSALNIECITAFRTIQ